MVFLTIGFWRHCLMAILMQSVFRILTTICSCATLTCYPLFSPGYRRHLHWQEMPLHWKCLHSWPYPLWSVQHSVWMLQWFSINLFPYQYHPCFSYTNATLIIIIIRLVVLNVASHVFYWTLHDCITKLPTINPMTNLMFRLLLFLVATLQMMFYHDGLPNPLGSEDTA